MSFLNLLPAFYQYCDRNDLQMDQEDRMTIEEFCAWLDTHTDSEPDETQMGTGI